MFRVQVSDFTLYTETPVARMPASVKPPRPGQINRNNLMWRGCRPRVADTQTAKEVPLSERREIGVNYFFIIGK